MHLITEPVTLDTRPQKVEEEHDFLERLNRLLAVNNMDDSGRAFRWLFNDEQLRKTPSAQLGISHGQELVFRQKQAMLMQALGQKSGLTQLAINTSVVFMHRFYMYRSVKFYPRIHVAVGFVFAAGKVEESARKLEHLIRTSIDILRHNKNGEFLDKRDKLTYEMDCELKEKIDTLCQNNCNIESQAYLEMRRTVLECEAEIYAVIGFHLQIVHPHNFVIRMCALLGAENIKDISQYAYNLATASSQLTLLCLKYKPELIATVCLNIAAKAHSVKFMCMKDSTVQWYQVYDQTMDIKEIESVSEEFLSLIKSCQLLPSWMTSLARASKSNPRSMPGSSRNLPHSSSTQGHQSRVQQPSSHSSSFSQPSSQNRDPSKVPPPSSSSSQSEHQGSSASSVGEGAPANGSHYRPPVSAEGSSGGSEHSIKEISHSSSSQTSGSARPHLSASGASSGANVPSSRSLPNSHPSQHRPHPHSSGERLSSSQPLSSSSQIASSGASASNRLPPNPLSRHSSSSSLPSGGRPHSSSSSNLPPPSRPRFDPNRPDGTHRSEVSEVRRSSRPMPPPEDANRNSHPPRPADHPTSQRPVEPPVQTALPKLATPPEMKPPSPVSLMPEAAAAAASMSNSNLQGLDNTQVQESASTSQISDPNKLRGSTSSSKLSLSSYRERIRSRPVPPSVSDSITDDSGLGNTVTSDDTLSSQDIFKETSVTDSPALLELKPSASAPELTSFNMAQDSPNNPRIKIKVKRDPSSGERHSVKYADSGLKIKIKPPRIDPAEGEPGPSSSRSGTPIEEGEVVDSPNSTSSGDRKVEGGLKIRLSVPPRSGDSSSYSRSSEQMNGYSEHRSHHHGHHHRSHHSHKSKKHSSKHSSSRHERSSKRPSSYDQEERQSKHPRLDYQSQSTSSSGELHRNYSDVGARHESSRSLQHQNSGFSINDAFSSTLPTNIFDEDDDTLHIPPPVTPTPDALPSHHDRFHLLMSKHRAQQYENPPRPPLPSDKGPPPPPPPPPSPPPPSSL